MEKISENYRKLIDQKMVGMGLDRYVSYEVFDDPNFKIKEDCKLGYVILVPKKIRENTEVIDLLIFFNEVYLDELALVTDRPLLDLAIDKVLNSIYFDAQKDEVKKSNENVIEFASILKKYGIDFVIEEYRTVVEQLNDKINGN